MANTTYLKGLSIATLLALACPALAGPPPLLETKYREEDKLIYLQVRINDDAPRWFCLDSGAYHTVIDTAYAKEIGIQETSTGSGKGTGQGSVSMGRAAPLSMKLGSMSWTITEPLLIDLSKVPFLRESRGLIGAEVFEAHVVRIDPKARTIAFFDPATYEPPPAAAHVPLVVENHRFYVEAKLDVKPGLSVSRRLRVDTGSGDAVNDASVKDSASVRKTTLGNGLGANYESVSGVFEAVHLGPFTVRDVWGPGGENSAIGMEMMRRFTLTFDVPRRRLYLEPNEAFREPVPAPS